MTEEKINLNPTIDLNLRTNIDDILLERLWGKVSKNSILKNQITVGLHRSRSFDGYWSIWNYKYKKHNYMLKQMEKQGLIILIKGVRHKSVPTFQPTNKFHAVCNNIEREFGIPVYTPHNDNIPTHGTSITYKKMTKFYIKTKEYLPICEVREHFNENIKFIFKLQHHLNKHKLFTWIKRSYCITDNDQILYGRFYTKLTQLSKAERLRMRFGRKLAAEVDFSNFNPRLAYHLSGVDYEGDAYEIPGVPRNHVKYALVPAFFGGGVRSIKKSLKNNDIEYSTNQAQKLMDQIKQKHSLLVEEGYIFHSNVISGFELGTIESDVLYRVMDKLIDKNCPFIPVHDCIVAPKTQSNMVKTMLGNVYKEVLREYGVNGKITPKLTVETK